MRNNKGYCLFYPGLSWQSLPECQSMGHNCLLYPLDTPSDGLSSTIVSKLTNVFCLAIYSITSRNDSCSLIYPGLSWQSLPEYQSMGTIVYYTS
ncbi:hypothetical protein [Liberibacter crescens]|uniref:hypothetical protein n=1 Tax=Liberibacter crescens TaxID=1273132 RepID=UPI0012EE36A1|nr:hypothetical protein [Liberibacter crescens]